MTRGNGFAAITMKEHDDEGRKELLTDVLVPLAEVVAACCNGEAA